MNRPWTVPPVAIRAATGDDLDRMVEIAAAALFPLEVLPTSAASRG